MITVKLRHEKEKSIAKCFFFPDEFDSFNIGIWFIVVIFVPILLDLRCARC